MDQIEARAVAAVFLTLLENKSTLISRAGKNRQTMLDALKNDADLTSNARFQWLEKTAVSVIKSIAVEAKAFNASNPNDTITVQDMVDVFTRAIALLQHAAKR